MKSVRSRQLSGDREGETAANIEEDMTASLKPRSFKMKKKERTGVQVCVSRRASMLSFFKTVVAVSARARVQARTADRV